jgi:Mn2+/Fe2+ NRAMP family transporter
MSNRKLRAAGPRSAVLDAAHVGDIEGALGTIYQGDTKHRTTWKARLATLLAIIGPGLIVMVGDNDAGAFSTYTQAGQNYGTSLLWTLLLLVPVLYVNQEMVLRLGAVSGVGHARLILERFGKFWGAFSVIDLFLLNALTIVTEFIGLTLAFGYLGVPEVQGVLGAAILIMGAASTGNFRRFERFSLVLVLGSLLLVPVFVMNHPPLARTAYDMVVPQLPADGKLADVMLLIIAIVGTTVAPWQLFFQQSYVVDKRITPRFIQYERADLWIGILLVIVGGVAMMAFAAATFAGRPEFGNFADAGAVAVGLDQYVGHAAGVLFALALIDACIIGASAVSLSSAYAIGDVLSLRHSLHRKPMDAKGFYAVYFGLIALSAALVLTPGTPLGLLTNAVQTLAGILLPSATVFLLLLCNDKDVLGPWANGRKLNLFTGGVIAILVMLSIILTASVLFPELDETQIIAVLVGGSVLAAVTAIGVTIYERRRGREATAEWLDDSGRATWRMRPLDQLPPARLTLLSRIWLIVLRGYLVLAAGLVLLRIVQLAVGSA